MAGLTATRARGRRGGRTPALLAKDLTAKAMLKDPEIMVEKVAPSTLYRHLPGGRSSLAKAGE